jgi:hypothetical protein
VTVEQILAWADAHHARTGAWPTPKSGLVADTPAESWATLNAALWTGVRGLPGGDSLYRLLRRTGRVGERRGRPRQVGRQRLARRLRARGLTMAEIGDCLGITRQAAWQLLNRTSVAAGSQPG